MRVLFHAVAVASPAIGSALDRAFPRAVCSSPFYFAWTTVEAGDVCDIV